MPNNLQITEQNNKKKSYAELIYLELAKNISSINTSRYIIIKAVQRARNTRLCFNFGNSNKNNQEIEICKMKKKLLNFRSAKLNPHEWTLFYNLMIWIY